MPPLRARVVLEETGLPTNKGLGRTPPTLAPHRVQPPLGMQPRHFWMNEGEWTNVPHTVWVTSHTWVRSHCIITRTHFSAGETETQRGEGRGQDTQQRRRGAALHTCLTLHSG